MGAEDRIPGKRSFVGKERKQPILEKEVIAGKELIVTKKAIAHIVRNVASGKSKIVATSAEPARDNPSSNGPEWRPIVPDELARYSEVARLIGLSFRFPRCLAPADDVTAVRGGLREGGLV